MVFDSIVYETKPPLDLYDTSPDSLTFGPNLGALTRYVLEDPDAAATSSETHRSPGGAGSRRVVPVKSTVALPWAPPSVEMPRINPLINGRPYRYFYGKLN